MKYSDLTYNVKIIVYNTIANSPLFLHIFLMPCSPIFNPLQQIHEQKWLSRKKQNSQFKLRPLWKTSPTSVHYREISFCPVHLFISLRPKIHQQRVFSAPDAQSKVCMG